MLEKPRHPGQYIRDTYLDPQGLSVTAAAKLIGISRPGVSNFLNGRVSATENMATRIERVFGLPAADLLRMQAEYNAAFSSPTNASAETKAYVPPFLNIRANEIQDWASNNIPARIRLSVFLRTLVNSTGVALARVDFPGNDDAERPGWDGFTETSAGTPWIPKGKTGWEFGVTDKIKKKADHDFEKSIKAHANAAERAEMTFVFVTPRRWSGKGDWALAMQAKKQWKDVRAYDASDLEQWLEQSPAAQAWFAGETQRLSEGVRSLDRCWSDWADVATPPLAAELFDTAKTIVKPQLVKFLGAPAERPLVVTADSNDEALAAIAQTFADPDLVSKRDRVLVFDRPGSLTKLAHGNQDFIAIVHTREVERELGPFASKLHAIVVYPKNALNDTPNVALEPVTHEALRKGLEVMKLDRDQITRLGEESGHSLTILRRRHSNLPAIRMPAWASDPTKSRWLVPMVLLGAWNATNETDKTAVTLLAGDGTRYEDIEARVQELLRLEDAPVWSIGDYRGVVSKIDALFAIAPAITLSDLRRHLELAKMILGEDDPSLDLPENERWLADIKGKRREFSSALRAGASETLVLLAVHGRNLFRMLDFDGEMEVSRFVSDLLLPLTTRKLEANSSDLPIYAEAAPGAFLRILEDDLQGDSPTMFGLLRPVDTALFGVRWTRSGLLWALEGLAWNPQTFHRTIMILARLADVEINDNLANKPIASLQSIFRSWMPQTAVGHDGRLATIKKLFETYPAVAWRLCVYQFDGHSQEVGQYTHKPKWRPDGYGFGEPFEFEGPGLEFRIAMIELALSQPNYTPDMLCDLVGRLHGLGSEFQQRVWDIIDKWRNGTVTDPELAQVREKVRVSILSHAARRRNSEIQRATLTEAARKIYAALEPTDSVQKHSWLFKNSWVEESADEIWGDEKDFNKRQERIAQLRAGALKEIHEEKGIRGVLDLALLGKAQYEIGWHMARDVLAKKNMRGFILDILKEPSNSLSFERRATLEGALGALSAETRVALLLGLRSSLSNLEIARLAQLAPFEPSMWHLVDHLPEEARNEYWANVRPSFIFDPSDMNNRAVELLLKAKRPRAAFAATQLNMKVVRTDLIMELLTEIARSSDERESNIVLRSDQVVEAFSLLNDDPNTSLEKKAALEFAYIETLAPLLGGDRGNIGNLELYVERNPIVWVQALAWTYRRKNGGEDPSGFGLPEGRSDLAQRGYRLLEGIRRIPGLGEEGAKARESLFAWIETVRKSSAEIDRLKSCDINLGQLLSHAPKDADGVWPCGVVRDVMEKLNSPDVFQGARTGLYNSRGVQWRGEGGTQERELAAKYREWAIALRYTHPHLSSSLLMEMAQTYEEEAKREDSEAGIRRRLRR